ncbi:MAG: hypothetical protein AMJ69_11520 [Gammaproteobacteria bacterium SG8_47]|nr:MAG: hypothetical protein AMJ69_11520 [Gammaproteobacteria bacterium SG8_47]
MNTRYFQYSLAWPIVLPLLLWAVAAVVGMRTLSDHVPDALMIAGWIVWASLLFGGLPYLGCAIWAYRKLNGASPKQAIALWWRLPLVFLVIDFICLALAMPVATVVESGSWQGAAVGVPQALFLSLFVLPVGYFYALLVVGGYRLSQWLHQRRGGKSSRWCLGCD